MSSTIGGVRIVDMPDLGAFSDTSSLVGERAGSGRFGASGLNSYLSGRFLALSGGTLTGPLTLAADPATELGASTKQYADAGDLTRVAKAGDTMTGLLLLSGNPTAALGAATKQYVDTRPYAALVADIGSLRALTSVSSTAVWVAGYHANADGGEGMFQYNASDTTTADNGGTVIVDAGGHRWVRQGVQGEVTVLQFGAVPDGSGDQTGSIQAAINWVAGDGGGVVRVPPGSYRLTGTLAISTSKVRLVGDSMYGCVFTFDNVAGADCIRVGFQATAVSDVVVSSLTLQGGVGKTGGSGVNASRIAYCQFNNLNVQSVPNGISVAILNNVWIDTCQVVCSTAGFACINWTSPANATDRSDVLTITDTVVNAQGNGQIGLHIDGNCQTLRVNRLGIVHCNYGLQVENSAASNTYYPQFIYCDDMEIDAVDHIGMHLKAGRQMHFVNTTVFNAGGGANTAALYIGSDGGHSVTNYITFTNCAFAGANQQGVLCYAREVDFVNCYIGDNSVAGSNLYDGVSLGDEGTGAGPAGSIGFVGGSIGAVFGDLTNQRYGISVATGCTGITVVGVDFTSCVTAAISDGSGGFGNVSWQGCLGINRSPLPDRLQQVAADPSGANLIEGMVWENVTTFALKVCLNGAVKTVTVT
jgi:hypothetical protein